MILENSFENYVVLRNKYIINTNEEHDLKSFLEKYKSSLTKEEINSIKLSIDNWNNSMNDKILL